MIENDTVEYMTNNTGKYWRKKYYYHPASTGIWPFITYGKGFANRGGFIQWIKGSPNTIKFSISNLIEDGLLDYKLASLSIDFVI